MSDVGLTPLAEDLEPLSGPAPNRARVTLIKRLADVVSLPSSRVNAFERAMTSDLLVEMLREASMEEKHRVARRVAQLAEIPHDIVRVLLADQVEVAEPLLEEAHLSNADLIACARTGSRAHQLLIARRRELADVVVDALVERQDLAVIETLLRNATASFTQPGIETAMVLSRAERRLTPLLMRRRELRPSHAYVMFWWCEPDERRAILQRFAVGREVLQDVSSDVFSIAAAEGWTDALVRKALQFIERRQRNRAAQARSPYEDLESAIEAAEAGLTRPLAQEIAYLSGLKPTTAAQIFTDPYGEPLAVLCKAAGLPRRSLMSLWRSSRRPEKTATGDIDPDLSRTLETFDMMAVDRAQTVLRYWNWALSSALSPTLLKAIRDGDNGATGDYSLPERAAMLALGANMSRSEKI